MAKKGLKRENYNLWFFTEMFVAVTKVHRHERAAGFIFASSAEFLKNIIEGGVFLHFQVY